MPKNSQLAKKVKQLEKKVADIEDDIEYKYKDTAYAFNMLQTGVVSDLGLGSITSGTTTDNRLGKQINVSSIRLRGYINYGDNFNRWRILVVRLMTEDRTLDGLNVSDILADTNNWYNSFYRRHSMVKFKVEADRRGFVNGPMFNSASSSSVQATNFKPYQNLNINLKWKGGLKVTYSSDALSLPTRNPVFIILLSDSIISDHPDYRVSSRITYTDA